MSLHICLNANTLRYPRGGGHLWVYLNWALGLMAMGHRVTWLELIGKKLSDEDAHANLNILKENLRDFGLADSVAAYYWPRESFAVRPPACLPLEAALEADVLINFQYGAPAWVVSPFRKSVLIDIDPGLLQLWMTRGRFEVAGHTHYFSIGESVGRADAQFPDAGINWQYTPPCVALDAWPVASGSGPFTTISHWESEEWADAADGTLYRNDKRTGFAPYMDLPSLAGVPLELALAIGDDDVERANITARGWSIRDSADVSSTPLEYRKYIQQSRGEFSCAKPSCVVLQTAWISDRTICYLASGKPAVVQHTGPSRILPNAAGLFRFQYLDEAVHSLSTVAQDYENQSRLARALAEEHFDARKVTGTLLEQVLN